MSPMPPTDPLLYRFYELIMVNGPAWKELIQEEFGDGIMSAIDFDMAIDASPIPRAIASKSRCPANSCPSNITAQDPIRRTMARNRASRGSVLRPRRSALDDFAGTARFRSGERRSSRARRARPRPVLAGRARHVPCDALGSEGEGRRAGSRPVCRGRAGFGRAGARRVERRNRRSAPRAQSS